MSNKQEKEVKDLTEKRDKKVKEVAIGLYRALADQAEDGELVYGSTDDITEESLYEYYQGFYRDHLIKPILKANLTIEEANYLFRLLKQPIGMAKQIFDVTMERRTAEAVEKVWGEERLNEIPMQELNEFLTSKKDFAVPMSKEEVTKPKPSFFTRLRSWFSGLVS